MPVYARSSAGAKADAIAILPLTVPCAQRSLPIMTLQLHYPRQHASFSLHLGGT